jgi:hypothetical protein
MDDRSSRASGQQKARVHDYDEHRQEQQSSGNGSEGNAGARIFDEAKGQFHEAGERARERVEQTADAAAEEFSSLANAWMNSGSIALGTAAHLLVSCQRESANFFSMRVEKDMQFGRKLADVRDPYNLAKVSSEFAESLFLDYATCISEITKRSLADAQQRASQILQNSEEAAEHLLKSAERVARR